MREPGLISKQLRDSGREEIKDKAVPEDIGSSDWSNTQFVRLVAIGKRFTKVNFSSSTFDSCYLRNCQFDRCNFTGAHFVSTNMHGAKFRGCVFDYALFERTVIDDDVLTDNCPSHENLKMRFARSLRMNYQQMGNAFGVNRAIRVELDATEVHLYKAWRANDHYYRTKYRGALRRAIAFLSWLKFKFLDYAWGNGESLLSLLRAVLVILVLIVGLDFSYNPIAQPILAGSLRAPSIFFGVAQPEYIPLGWLTVIVILRLVFFGFFMAIVIKRFNRR